MFHNAKKGWGWGLRGCGTTKGEGGGGKEIQEANEEGRAYRKDPFSTSNRGTRLLVRLLEAIRVRRRDLHRIIVQPRLRVNLDRQAPLLRHLQVRRVSLTISVFILFFSTLRAVGDAYICKQHTLLL